MKRRDSFKALVASTVAGFVLASCDDKKTSEHEHTLDASTGNFHQTPEEIERDKKLLADKFFTPDEFKTVSRLVDMIIPADEKAGGALDAKTPEFIEFMMKDKPKMQTPMRGGLRWLDLQCLKRFEKPFVACAEKEQTTMLDLIAYPEKATPDMKQGVAFFNTMRNLTATGFYTSEIGMKYLGYDGNRPNNWDGVPADVLKQYGFA